MLCMDTSELILDDLTLVLNSIYLRFRKRINKKNIIDMKLI